jgi:hypothetical protein
VQPENPRQSISISAWHRKRIDMPGR